jgi:hypothetical protein
VLRKSHHVAVVLAVSRFSAGFGLAQGTTRNDRTGTEISISSNNCRSPSVSVELSARSTHFK